MNDISKEGIWRERAWVLAWFQRSYQKVGSSKRVRKIHLILTLVEQTYQNTNYVRKMEEEGEDREET